MKKGESMMFDLNAFSQNIICENELNDAVAEAIINGNTLELYISAQNSKPKTTQKSTQKTTQKTTQKNAQKILSLLRQNPTITRTQIAVAARLTPDSVKWNLDKLKASGIIRRVGPDRGGHWEIVEG